MPHAEDVTIELSGVQLTDADSKGPVMLAQIRGVQVLVLLRHRH